MGYSMTLNQLLENNREEILEIAARNGAQNIRVINFANGKENPTENSIEFLVKMEDGRTLMDVGGLLIELQQLLGYEVNVVTEPGLRDSNREQILKEAVPV